jgi:hypothetical protein
MANFKINGGIVADFTNDGWDEFKKWLDGTYARLKYAWVDEGLAYNIVALDDGVYRTCSINKSEAQEFEAVYKRSFQIGVAITAQGRLPTAAARPVAPKLTFITPNWCDKTTWYCGSVEIEDEIATDSGDHTTYSVAHQNMIDAYHGKITFEGQLRDDDGSNYRVTVKVNGVKKTEQDPHLVSGGDFIVNYVAGTVTFLTALQPGDVVTVTYHYAQKATFVVKPAAGKRLYIGSVEVQFSEDIVMNDTFVFQAYGLVDVFAPQLMPGVPSGTKIPLGDPLVYKTMVDLLNDSNDSHPAYPALGGSNWRALKKPAYIFTWEYAVGLTCLEARYGMEIHIDLEHDIPCSGAFGTATLYCTSEDEA